MSIARTIAEPSRLLTRKEAAARFGVSVPTFDKLVIDGVAPKPVRVSGRAVRWHSGQLTDAIDSLAGITANSAHGYW